MKLSVPGCGRPTLARRMMLALLAAFCLVWAVLLARDFLAETDGARFDQRLLTLGGRVSAMLAGAASDDQARTITATMSAMVNDSYRDQGVPGAVLMQLDGADGAPSPSPLYRTPDGGALPARSGPQLSDVQIAGLPYRLYQHQVAGRTVRVAAPVIGHGWILRRMAAELAVYMLIALPLVLLPLWLAVRSGLRPLRQLSEQIVAKGPHDLAPLNAAPDYEELKPLAAALDHLLARLRHKLARETGFVQDAAHELRTPMAVISAQAHVLALAPDAAQRAAAEQLLDQAIARASDLVRQLLDMAQFEREREQHAPLALLDAAELARLAMAAVAPAAMQREIDLSLESPDIVLHTLDRHAFLSILDNLLHNAVRYVQAGGQVLVELQPASAAGDALTLAVTDNGPGIPHAEQALVFERFYRCTGQSVPGSGLGLSIVEQAVARLRGSVTLSTPTPSGGCRFVITIPA